MKQKRYCQDCNNLETTKPVWDEEAKEYQRKCSDCE